jgi:protoporphyrinogen oxidase
MIKTDVCIIGGGFSGLGAALRLSEQGYNVVVVEKENVLGGLAKSFLFKNKWIPDSYHHINESEDIILKYINKFGLSRDVIWKKVSKAFWYDNKPYLLAKPTDLLYFKPLNLKSKLNMLKLGIYVYFKKDYHTLMNVSAKKWLEKLMDKDSIDLIFNKLSRIKYDSLDEASAA